MVREKDRRQSRKSFVYMLVDPRDQRPYYIGQTSDPKRRLRQHSEKSGSYSAVRKRNEAIKRARKTPIMVILEAVGDELTAVIKELFWIDLLTGRGIDLCNRENRGYLYDRFETMMADVRIHQVQAAPAGRHTGAGRKRHGQPWSKDEAAELLQRHQRGQSTHDMAKAHGRSERAICKRLALLVPGFAP